MEHPFTGRERDLLPWLHTVKVAYFAVDKSRNTIVVSNVKFVPEFFDSKQATLEAEGYYADGRFGPHDPQLWSQEFEPALLHHAAMPAWRPPHHSVYGDMTWFTPLLEHLDRSLGFQGRGGAAEKVQHHMRRAFNDVVARYRDAGVRGRQCGYELDTEVLHVGESAMCSLAQQNLLSYVGLLRLVAAVQRSMAEMEGYITLVKLLSPALDAVRERFEHADRETVTSLPPLDEDKIANVRGSHARSPWQARMMAALGLPFRWVVPYEEGMKWVKDCGAVEVVLQRFNEVRLMHADLPNPAHVAAEHSFFHVFAPLPTEFPDRSMEFDADGFLMPVSQPKPSEIFLAIHGDNAHRVLLEMDRHADISQQSRRERSRSRDMEVEWRVGTHHDSHHTSQDRGGEDLTFVEDWVPPNTTALKCTSLEPGESPTAKRARVESLVTRTGLQLPPSQRRRLRSTEPDAARSSTSARASTSSQDASEPSRKKTRRGYKKKPEDEGRMSGQRWPIDGYMGVRELPEWFPTEARWISDAVLGVAQANDRQTRLAQAERDAVPAESKRKQEPHRLPLPYSITNISGQLKAARALKRWLAYRPDAYDRLSTFPRHELPGLTAQQWKTFLVAEIHDEEREVFDRMLFSPAPSPLRPEVFAPPATAGQATRESVQDLSEDDSDFDVGVAVPSADAALATLPLQCGIPFDLVPDEDYCTGLPILYDAIPAPRKETERIYVQPRDFHKLAHKKFITFVWKGGNVFYCVGERSRRDELEVQEGGRWVEFEHRWTFYFGKTALCTREGLRATGERVVDLRNCEFLTYDRDQPYQYNPPKRIVRIWPWRSSPPIPGIQQQVERALTRPLQQQCPIATALPSAPNVPALVEEGRDDLRQHFEARALGRQLKLRGIIVDLVRVALGPGEFASTRNPGEVWAPTPAWRALLMWELLEIGFMYELFDLDVYIRSLRANVDGDRRAVASFAMVTRCWDSVDGPFDAFHHEIGGPFCSDNLMVRRRAINAVFDVLKGWPRLPEELQGLAQDAWTSMLDKIFMEKERQVWAYYAQTFVDYRHRLPLLPHVRPNRPWLASSSGSHH